MRSLSLSLSLYRIVDVRVHQAHFIYIEIHIKAKGWRTKRRAMNFDPVGAPDIDGVEYICGDCGTDNEIRQVGTVGPYE